MRECKSRMSTSAIVLWHCDSSHVSFLGSSIVVNVSSGSLIFRRQFVLENELHILYLIVPIYAAVSWPKLSWLTFLSMWEALRYKDDIFRGGGAKEG